MKDKEIKRIEEIVGAYSYNGKFCCNEISYYDLTKKCGGYGDYKILVVKIKREYDDSADRYYLFVNHKGSVIIWILDKKMEIIEQVG